MGSGQGISFRAALFAVIVALAIIFTWDGFVTWPPAQAR